MLQSGRTDGKRWDEILADEAGLQELADEDLKARLLQLEAQLNRPATDEELCLYVQFPRDALDFIKFEERFGQTWLLPPDVWFHEGGIPDGARSRLPMKPARRTILTSYRHSEPQTASKPLFWWTTTFRLIRRSFQKTGRSRTYKRTSESLLRT